MFARSRVSERSSRFRTSAACITVTNVRPLNLYACGHFWRTTPGALAVIDDVVDVPEPDRRRRLTLTRYPTDRVIADAPSLYQRALQALRLLERFPQPDWSIADYRVARWLLQRDFSTAEVTAGPPATEPRLSTLSSQP